MQPACRFRSHAAALSAKHRFIERSSLERCGELREPTLDVGCRHVQCSGYRCGCGVAADLILAIDEGAGSGEKIRDDAFVDCVAVLGASTGASVIENEQGEGLNSTARRAHSELPFCTEECR